MYYDKQIMKIKIVPVITILKALGLLAGPCKSYEHIQ
jgi:hypothetical protein